MMIESETRYCPECGRPIETWWSVVEAPQGGSMLRGDYVQSHGYVYHVYCFEEMVERYTAEVRLAWR